MHFLVVFPVSKDTSLAYCYSPVAETVNIFSEAEAQTQFIVRPINQTVDDVFY